MDNTNCEVNTKNYRFEHKVYLHFRPQFYLKSHFHTNSGVRLQKKGEKLSNRNNALTERKKHFGKLLVCHSIVNILFIKHLTFCFGKLLFFLNFFLVLFWSTQKKILPL